MKEELNTLEIFAVESKCSEEACQILLKFIKDEDVGLMSIELLFDIHNVERILFSEAINSCFIDTDSAIYYEMRQLATMTDEEQLFSKLTKRNINERLREALCDKFDEFSKSCTKSEEIKDIAYHCGELQASSNCI